jgi:hypothetical protein
MPTRNPAAQYYLAISLLLCLFHSTDAAAEQFSVVCRPHGVSEYLTFDDQTKRVIGYGIGVEGQIVNAIFKGHISSISPDEIQFDLIIAFDEIRVGDFTLSRKEGWLRRESSPEHGDAKNKCLATPLRSVMELRRLLKINEARSIGNQLSYLCKVPGVEWNLTFDDRNKHVINYNFIDGKIVSGLSTGNISTFSTEVITFSLALTYLPDAKLGDFILNRKQNWLISSLSNYADKMPCAPIPSRSVMDLWQALGSDP